MAENGYSHMGRIPNYGKTQANPMGAVEPPACIQNAMMTKDKKPFTYTPGGLDLSQIKTPSMARRLARQRSQEEHEQAYAQQKPNGGSNYQQQAINRPQGGAPPPPPPMNMPAPPPPPPLIIEAPKPASKSPKPSLAPYERPEIIIPDNPIGMLRKTNSPYHWESEKAEIDRVGPVPKFVEKVPSPLTVKMPPSSFTQQSPQNYSPYNQNNGQRFQQNNQPSSPLHKPEAQYPSHIGSPVTTSPPVRECLQRQDSQFNKSPAPFAGQSPISNGSPFSPSPNTSWRQPERRDSPANSFANSPQNQFSPKSQPQSPYQNQFASNSEPSYNALPKINQTPQDNYNQYQNSNNKNINQVNQQSPEFDSSNVAPWRVNKQHPDIEPPSIYHNSQPMNQQPTYTPPWMKSQEVNNNQENYNPPWKRENKNEENHSQQYSPPWAMQDNNKNKISNSENTNPHWIAAQNNKTSPPQIAFQDQEPPRYQSSMSIPVTPRKQKQPEQEYKNTPPHKEIVYVNQEPVYFCPGSPQSQSVPGFVRAQKEKTKTPPPIWCQRPLENRKSLPRELETPPRDTNQEPEWVKKSNQMQRGAREIISPPKYQQSAQPSWSTLPSENRKSLPKDTPHPSNGSRVIPIQMEVSNEDSRNRYDNQPPLRITIGVQPNANYQGQSSPQGPYSQPTQRIMRVLSPQLVRLDDGPQFQHDLPSLNRNLQSQQDSQPKTRIIPIQIEGGGSNGANQSFGGRY